MRIAIVTALVAFLVLLLNGTAYPADVAAVRRPVTSEPTSEVERILLHRGAVSPAERVFEARALLDRDRRNRVAGLACAVTEAGLRLASGGSPRSLLSSARGIWSQARRWMTVSPAEQRALELLEPEVDAGTADASIRTLYEVLRERETSGLVRRKLGEAERALARGDLRRARRRLASARSHDPASPRLAALTRELEEREALRRIPAPERRLAAASPVSRSELQLAASFLLGRYHTLAEVEPETDEARLMRAVARYLDGDVDRALADLRALSERQGGVGELADAWLADPSIVDPDRELRRAGRRHRLDRALTWVGGAGLRSQGTDLSLDGIRAWREALAPLNLALGLPARALRGDEPPSDAVRSAATRYLKLQPDGPRAEESVDWMSRAELSRAMRRRGAAWDDGRLVLPAARTPYPRILGHPVLVTSRLLRKLDIPKLAEHVESADALVLATNPHALGGEGEPLALDAALALIRELARGVESGDVRPFGRNRRAALESLRRFDGAVRSGMAQAWVSAWSDRTGPARASLRDLFADGDEHRLAHMEVERGRKRLRASRSLFGSEISCPAHLVCVGQNRAWSGSAYAEVRPDGSIRVSTRARFHDLAVSIELEELVPSASLSIPVARWFHLDRWLPVAARLGVGLDGISVTPVIQGQGVEAPVYTAEGAAPSGL
jgi:hypothetical protein